MDALPRSHARFTCPSPYLDLPIYPPTPFLPIKAGQTVRDARHNRQNPAGQRRSCGSAGSGGGGGGGGGGGLSATSATGVSLRNSVTPSQPAV
jgi:hypothetical protein